ncbi:hypothetical protein D3C74_389990 [compost metagenome]
MGSDEAGQLLHCSSGQSLPLARIVNQERTQQYGPGCIRVKVRNPLSTVKDKKAHSLFLPGNDDSRFIGVG